MVTCQERLRLSDSIPGSEVVFTAGRCRFGKLREVTSSDATSRSRELKSACQPDATYARPLSSTVDFTSAVLGNLRRTK